ncbi:hypothetical protein [Microcoleus sp. D3_18_C2]|uniref:hypothetical protein n=1 Tax=Microcoleus sp. D3_18_C2 TaxID=3055334 RepID=UPI002FD3C158
MRLPCPGNGLAINLTPVNLPNYMILADRLEKRRQYQTIICVNPRASAIKIP